MLRDDAKDEHGLSRKGRDRPGLYIPLYAHFRNAKRGVLLQLLTVRRSAVHRRLDCFRLQASFGSVNLKSAIGIDRRYELFRVRAEKEARLCEQSYETAGRSCARLIIAADNCGVFSARSWIKSIDIRRRKPGSRAGEGEIESADYEVTKDPSACIRGKSPSRDTANGWFRVPDILHRAPGQR